MSGEKDLCREHHVEKRDERLELFRGLVGLYGVRSALYPGSFVRVTPLFVIPSVVYVDSDRRAAGFFADAGLLDLLRKRCEYEAEPQIRFHRGDFEAPIDEPDQSFDLFISQYAGFVCRSCKRYLRIGGHLVANNSHGDASMAALDPDYELVAVYRRRGDWFSFSSSDLGSYMIPKRGVAPTRAELERGGRGPAFTRVVAGYVFVRRK